MEGFLFGGFSKGGFFRGKGSFWVIDFQRKLGTGEFTRILIKNSFVWLAFSLKTQFYMWRYTEEVDQRKFSKELKLSGGFFRGILSGWNFPLRLGRREFPGNYFHGRKKKFQMEINPFIWTVEKKKRHKSPDILITYIVIVINRITKRI